MNDTQHTYPPKPERERITPSTSSHVGSGILKQWAAIEACEAHYEPQIKDLKDRVERLEGGLRELVEASDRVDASATASQDWVDFSAQEQHVEAVNEWIAVRAAARELLDRGKGTSNDA